MLKRVNAAIANSRELCAVTRETIQRSRALRELRGLMRCAYAGRQHLQWLASDSRDEDLFEAAAEAYLACTEIHQTMDEVWPDLFHRRSSSRFPLRAKSSHTSLRFSE